ncbi:alpha-(1,3)-fucosyltransferase C-like [Watersipora subatra]|uniref:alpha-(1,3)-fucosyltransferase C-like n=1 Tax=Watersipora subatra TaxID=2589382 RepID=UPI00355B544D
MGIVKNFIFYCTVILAIIQVFWVFVCYFHWNRLLTPILTVNNVDNLTEHRTFLPQAVKPEQASKLILAYTTVYGKSFSINRFRKPWEIQAFPDPFEQCTYKCEWTIDPSDYNRSDAVIFHLYNMSPDFLGHGYREFVLKDLPRRIHTEQKWVLMVREPSAFYYPNQLKLLNNLFNLSMSYVLDADVFIPYGGFRKLSPDFPKAVNIANLNKEAGGKLWRGPITRRSKQIAWLVSNCITSSRREEFVEELQKYIDVDIYGGCSVKKNMPIFSKKDRKLLGKRYVFYLALENSDCDDYITEKFWISLIEGMIPIVKGRRVDYKKFAPDNSYIHADDFESVSHLASHLKTVFSDSKLLSSYHQWRSSYVVELRLLSSNKLWMCDLCQQVHESERKTIDVYEQFSEDTRCYTFDRKRNRTGEHMEDILHYEPLPRE